MDNKILISSSSPEPDKRSPLLRLPDELLALIFQSCEYFWTRDAPRAICRRLRPIQQECMYKRIRLRSYQSLKSLCETVHESTYIGTLVIELWICPRWGGAPPNEMPSEDDSAASTGSAATTVPVGRLGDERRKIVQPVQLFSLLSRLSRLRRLHLYRADPALVDVFMVDSQGTLDFPHMAEVGVDFAGAAVSSGQGAGAWVRRLARLPALESLRVFHRETSTILPIMQTPLPLFTSLTDLSLEGSSIGATDLPALDIIMPHLVSLRIVDSTTAPRCAKILRTAPTGLRRLGMSTVCGHPGQAVFDCLVDDVLPRFGRLEELTLSPESFTPNRLAPYLASLPALHSLAFSWKTCPTDDLLHSLLIDDKSPHRLRHLRTLILDHATADLDRTWRAPRFLVGCTARGLKAAVAAARAAGIEVDGGGITAIGWDEAYARERGVRLLVWGDQKGDFSQARAELGDAVVDQWVTALEKARLEADEKARLGTVEE
ncbi:hypothetical protein JCM9279_002575 [Rhodotorula babjevae]